MSVKDRAISLLGQGYANTVVAAAVGVTPSYITQILEEPGALEEVNRLRSVRLEQAAATDLKIEDLEKKALQVVESKMPFVKSPMEAVKIFQALNGAKRKTGVDTTQTGNESNMVTLTLPAAMTTGASISISLNSNNQVVEVENRSMAPLPSRALQQLRPASDATDAKPKEIPTTKQIEESARLVQARRDAARAAKTLENVTRPISLILDGKELML